jgi:hypothetical protein
MSAQGLQNAKKGSFFLFLGCAIDFTHVRMVIIAVSIVDTGQGVLI